MAGITHIPGITVSKAQLGSGRTARGQVNENPEHASFVKERTVTIEAANSLGDHTRGPARPYPHTSLQNPHPQPTVEVSVKTQPDGKRILVETRPNGTIDSHRIPDRSDAEKMGQALLKAHSRIDTFL